MSPLDLRLSREAPSGRPGPRTVARYERVLTLRRDGLTLAAIAAEVGLSRSRVAQISADHRYYEDVVQGYRGALLRAILRGIKGYEGRRHCAAIGAAAQAGTLGRCAAVARMRAFRVTLSEVGQELGLTRERVRMIERAHARGDCECMRTSAPG